MTKLCYYSKAGKYNFRIGGKMQVSAIGHYQKFKSVTEEHRKPPVDVEQITLPPEHHHKKYNPVAITGWLSVASMLTAVVSGIKHMHTLHKISAFTAVASIAGHIGLISANHPSHRKNPTCLNCK